MIPQQLAPLCSLWLLLCLTFFFFFNSYSYAEVVPAGKDAKEEGPGQAADAATTRAQSESDDQGQDSLMADGSISEQSIAA